MEKNKQKKKYVKPEVIRIPVDFKKLGVRTGISDEDRIPGLICPDVQTPCTAY
ncbi:MAG: hypothetical protein NC898_03015 [Candidatus Omnitrophica bacterium]|nr:hypothetical protein [Candidatus Omnitrophota bacterium]